MQQTTYRNVPNDNTQYIVTTPQQSKIINHIDELEKELIEYINYISTNDYVFRPTRVKQMMNELKLKIARTN